jgi:hypothetical protein
LGSTQAPLQLICDPGHDTEHVPALHTWPLMQTAPALPPLTPHPVVAPQWPLLVLGSTHVPLQFTWLPPHEFAHVPLLQTSPLAHAVPADPNPPTPQPGVAPQCTRSLVGSTHVPLQLTSDPGHDTEQVPPLHTAPF